MVMINNTGGIELWQVIKILLCVDRIEGVIVAVDISQCYFVIVCLSWDC